MPFIYPLVEILATRGGIDTWDSKSIHRGGISLGIGVAIFDVLTSSNIQLEWLESAANGGTARAFTSGPLLLH